MREFCAMCGTEKDFEADNNICDKCIKEQATALFSVESARVNAISFDVILKMADEGKTMGDLIKLIEARENETN